ncbi:CAP domain-containing protein [Planotetraspora silvatica]|uniref:CAP domain-containing protein n=1 Tax=Planotetraspora silvatica TaxID=234614 RepID=UPI0019502C22|nr:CAP domain-containing protein [Planotetraspora silvatica]
MGLLACVLAILLLGVVVNRLTANSGGVDEVYLRNSQPSPSAVAASRKDRPPLEAVRPQASASRAATSITRPSATATTPSAGPSDRGPQRNPGFTRPPGRTGRGGGAKSFPSKKVVALVNIERAKAGCGPLRLDPRLVRSAQLHSLEMAKSNVFDHNSPDGETPWSRMAKAGYKDGGAENIARGYRSAEEAVRGWMNNPGDRRNMLTCRLVATGVGVAIGPGGPWWTEDFGYS